MRNLFGIVFALWFGCTGYNSEHSQRVDAHANHDMADKLDASASDVSQNCANIVLMCVVYNCTMASSECGRESSREECLNCIEKSRTGALCKYFISNC